MAQFLGGDGGNEAVEGLEVVLGAEVEALEHVVPEGRHLAILAAQEFLEGCRGIGVLALGGGELGLQLVDAHEHGKTSDESLL